MVCTSHKNNLKAQVGLLLPRFLIFVFHSGLVVTRVIRDRLLLHGRVVVDVVVGLLLAGVVVPAAVVVVARQGMAPLISFWAEKDVNRAFVLNTLFGGKSLRS